MFGVASAKSTHIINTWCNVGLAWLDTFDPGKMSGQCYHPVLQLQLTDERFQEMVVQCSLSVAWTICRRKWGRGLHCSLYRIRNDCSVSDRHGASLSVGPVPFSKTPEYMGKWCSTKYWFWLHVMFHHLLMSTCALDVGTALGVRTRPDRQRLNDLCEWTTPWPAAAAEIILQIFMRKLLSPRTDCETRIPE